MNLQSFKLGSAHAEATTADFRQTHQGTNSAGELGSHH